MMKRTIGFVLAALLLLCCGCSAEQEEIQVPVDYYYPYTIDQIVYNEERQCMDCEPHESKGHEKDLSYLLNEYFKGPNRADLASPFPKNLTVTSLEITGDILVLELSREFGQLSGLNLTIACACITQTCFALNSRLSRVQISAVDTQLDGSKWITMTRSSMILLDDGMPTTEPTADTTE